MSADRSGMRARGAEEIVDVRRYLAAIRRGLPLIVIATVLVTVAVFVISSVLPSTYQSTVQLVLFPSTSGLESSDAATIERQLATLQQLVTTDDVLAAAARRVPGQTTGDLQANTEASVDAAANLLNVAVTDRRPEAAAASANAIAAAFIASQRSIQQAGIQGGIRQVQLRIATLRRTGGNAEEIAALEQQLAEYGVQLETAGTNLRVAQQAVPSDDPASPKPFRNALIAMFAAIFVGVIVALARDRLVPRIGDAREYSRLTDIPVLVGLPYTGRKLTRQAGIADQMEHEGYETLAATIALTLPPDRKHILLVTSAMDGEGKTTVTARLGRALARAGHRTLLVSADTRRASLHEQLHVAPVPGLVEMLEEHERGKDHTAELLLREVLGRYQMVSSVFRSRQHALPDIIPSGHKPQNPAQLLSTDGLGKVMKGIAELDYSYVILDTPPLLGVADTQILAQHVDQIVVVARLDRITTDKVQDAREMLARLQVPVIGAVVIGVREEVSPYYLSAPATASSSSRPRAEPAATVD